MKFFFKRPFYTIAGKIINLMRDFQKHQDDKIIKAADESYNLLFGNNDFFEYNLENYIKINLYKESILSRLIYNGFEKDETDYVVSILSEGDIFIDVGANIGLFSLIASKKVGDKGLVISFEPSPTTFIRLVENVKLNNFNNIELRNIGLSDKADELTFYISQNGHDAWDSFAPRQDDRIEKEIKILSSSLDFELDSINKSLIKLIKIDVEGWEKFVLLGGKDFFINYNPIVMVEFTDENTFNAGYSVHEIYDLMQNWGYVWYCIVNGKLVKEIKKLYYPYTNLIAIKSGL